MRKSGRDDTLGWVIHTQHWVVEWKKLYPSKPAHCVAERLNAPVRTVEKWFSGEARPSFDWFGPILCAYGLGFVIGGMSDPAPWLDNLAREERTQRLMAERQAIDAQLAADWKRRKHA